MRCIEQAKTRGNLGTHLNRGFGRSGFLALVLSAIGLGNRPEDPRQAFLALPVTASLTSEEYSRGSGHCADTDQHTRHGSEQTGKNGQLDD